MLRCYITLLPMVYNITGRFGVGESVATAVTFDETPKVSTDINPTLRAGRQGAVLTVAQETMPLTVDMGGGKGQAHVYEGISPTLTTSSAGHAVLTGEGQQGPIASNVPAVDLSLLEKGRQALAEATTAPEVKEIRDKAEAIRLYARQQRLGLAAQNDAAEIKIWAEFRLGQMAGPASRGRPTECDAISHFPLEMKNNAGRKRIEVWRRVAALGEEEVAGRLSMLRWAGLEITTSTVILGVALDGETIRVYAGSMSAPRVRWRRLFQAPLLAGELASELGSLKERVKRSRDYLLSANSWEHVVSAARDLAREIDGITRARRQLMSEEE